MLEFIDTFKRGEESDLTAIAVITAILLFSGNLR
jgi:hypothetical protein